MPVLAAQDIYIRALCIWREMRGEGDQERLGCYWVISNRYTDRQKRWPQSVYGVVTERLQFSSFNAGDPNAALFPREGTPDWQAWLEIAALCDNPGADPTGGANAYEALPDGAPRPSWAQASKMTKQIGRTRFYKI